MNTEENRNHLEQLQLVLIVFETIFSDTRDLILSLSVTPSTVAENLCPIETTSSGAANVGRPKFCITSEVLEDLRNLGFTWTRVATMLGVSRWTISRRVREYGLETMTEFSDVSDEELDRLVKSYIDYHGTTTGQTYYWLHKISRAPCAAKSDKRMCCKARSTQHCPEMGCHSIPQSVLRTLAKFTLALGWPSFTDTVEVGHPWMHRGIL